MKYLPFSLFFAALLLIFSLGSSKAQAPPSYTSSEILLQLKKLNTVGSVLYIAAHPDDENTRLIAYLANEKCLRTGYLSLTRGDGGQNLIGPEQGVELGVIRTQELLAARRIDGGEQFFTRSYDFGYSKTPKETFSKWNHDSVLSDVVWVIRNFRPDIIITRFATDGSGGHGHHTASAMLAEEAFDAAGDPKRFPEQLQYVDVWQPRRLFYNATNRFRDPNADMSAFIKLDVGGYNPLLGKSYGEIAAESRSMHKSQGFGSAKQRGEYFEYFKPLKGDTAGLKDIFQGMDFSWGRISGGKKIEKGLEVCITKFSPEKVFAEMTDFLLQINQNDNLTWRQKDFYWLLAEKIKYASIGYFSEMTTSDFYVSSYDTLTLNIRMLNRSPNLSVWYNDSISFDNRKFYHSPKSFSNEAEFKQTIKLMVDSVGISVKPPMNYWIQKPIKNNMFDHFSYYITQKQPVWKFDSEGVNHVWSQKYYYRTHPLWAGFPEWSSLQYKWVDPEKGELYRPLVITPPVMINVVDEVLAFGNEPKEIKLVVKAGKDNVQGEAKLNLPADWKITPATIPFSLPKKGEEKTVSFLVTPPAVSSETTAIASVVYDGQTYSKGIKEIKYDHIPIQTLFPQAEIKLIKLDVKHKLKRIGYIPGAGDEVVPCLTQLGYEVITITDEMLAKEDLKQYEAIVTGVRAYNTNEKLPQFKQKLMDYVNNGGNLIVQYNTNSWAGPLSSDIGPYKFKITRDRIADEKAQVKFLLPQHPVFNYPNKITEKDFEGWIQERSIYHAGEWDSNYVAPISMADPDEKPNNGALIIAGYGKGHFVYTGLVFFRELPAGVPGAYRIFVNLIELGK